jgi:hypothetical protein
MEKELWEGTAKNDTSGFKVTDFYTILFPSCGLKQYVCCDPEKGRISLQPA